MIFSQHRTVVVQTDGRLLLLLHLPAKSIFFFFFFPVPSAAAIKSVKTHQSRLGASEHYVVGETYIPRVGQKKYENKKFAFLRLLKETCCLYFDDGEVKSYPGFMFQLLSRPYRRQCRYISLVRTLLQEKGRSYFPDPSFFDTTNQNKIYLA